MTPIVHSWKIFSHGQKNFRQKSAKLKYRWLQSSRLNVKVLAILRLPLKRKSIEPIALHFLLPIYNYFAKNNEVILHDSIVNKVNNFMFLKQKREKQST